MAQVKKKLCGKQIIDFKFGQLGSGFALTNRDIEIRPYEIKVKEKKDGQPGRDDKYTSGYSDWKS